MKKGQKKSFKRIWLWMIALVTFVFAWAYDAPVVKAANGTMTVTSDDFNRYTITYVPDKIGVFQAYMQVMNSDTKELVAYENSMDVGGSSGKKFTFTTDMLDVGQYTFSFYRYRQPGQLYTVELYFQEHFIVEDEIRPELEGGPGDYLHPEFVVQPHFEGGDFNTLLYEVNCATSLVSLYDGDGRIIKTISNGLTGAGSRSCIISDVGGTYYLKGTAYQGATFVSESFTFVAEFTKQPTITSDYEKVEFEWAHFYANRIELRDALTDEVIQWSNANANRLSLYGAYGRKCYVFAENQATGTSLRSNDFNVPEILFFEESPVHRVMESSYTFRIGWRKNDKFHGAAYLEQVGTGKIQFLMQGEHYSYEIDPNEFDQDWLGTTCRIKVEDLKYGVIYSEQFLFDKIYPVTYHDVLAYWNSIPQYHANHSETLYFVKGENALDREQVNNKGEHFVRWYANEDRTVPYDFYTPVTKAVDLYAKWVPITGSIGEVTVEGIKGEEIMPVRIELCLQGAEFNDCSSESFIRSNLPEGLQVGSIIYDERDRSHVWVEIVGTPTKVGSDLLSITAQYGSTNADSYVKFTENPNATFLISYSADAISTIEIDNQPEKIYAVQIPYKDQGISTVLKDYQVDSLTWYSGKTQLSDDFHFTAGYKYVARYEISITADNRRFAGNAVAKVNGSTEGVRVTISKDYKRAKVERVMIPSDETPSFKILYRHEGGYPIDVAETTIGSGKVSLASEVVQENLIFGDDAFLFTGWIIEGVLYAPGDTYELKRDVVAFAQFDGSRQLIRHGLKENEVSEPEEITGVYVHGGNYPEGWTVPVNREFAGWYSDSDHKVHGIWEGIDGQDNSVIHLYPVWSAKNTTELEEVQGFMPVPMEGETASLDGISFWWADATKKEDYAYVLNARNGNVYYVSSAELENQAQEFLSAQNGWYYNGTKFNGKFEAGKEYTLRLYLTAGYSYHFDADSYVTFRRNTDDKNKTYGTLTVMEDSDNQIALMEVTYTAKKIPVEMSPASVEINGKPVLGENIFVPEVFGNTAVGYTLEVDSWYEDDLDENTDYPWYYNWMTGLEYCGKETFEDNTAYETTLTFTAKEGYKFPEIKNNEDLAAFLHVEMDYETVPVKSAEGNQTVYYTLPLYNDPTEEELTVLVYYIAGVPKINGVMITFDHPGIGTSLENANVSCNAITGYGTSKYDLTIDNGGHWINGDGSTSGRIEAGGTYAFDLTLTAEGGALFVDSPKFVITDGHKQYPIFSENLGYGYVAETSEGKDEIHLRVYVTLDEFYFNENYDENLAVTKKSLTLFDTITIDFKVPATALEGYHDPYLIVLQDGAETKLTDYREDNGLLIFSYRVAPHQMGDDATAVPHALNAAGEDVKGAAFTYSVAEYCYNMLNKETYQTDAYAKLRRLLVDILLYGDAAQTYAGYKTDTLVSRDLTETQRAMGTDIGIEMSYENVKEKFFATVSEAEELASMEAAALYLEAAVNIQFKYLASNLSGLRVVVTGDADGTEVLGEYAADGTLIDAKGRYYVNFGGLNAGQMRKTVYATVMQGDKKVSNTYRYSIESYAASMRTDEGTTPLDKLLDAMMRYGDSAAAYAGNN